MSRRGRARAHNPPMTTGPEALYQQLGHLVAEMPDLARGEITPQVLLWLGRAQHVVNQVDPQDGRLFKVEADNLGINTLRPQNAHSIASRVYRALAYVEALIPAPSQGAFIPVGADFAVLQAVAKALEAATRQVMFVDPYLDHTVMTDFAPTVPSGVSIRLLTDSQYPRWMAALKPAVERWNSQFGADRRAEALATHPRALHDRLMVVDGQTVYTLTQSIKDFAARSPGTLVRLNQELATLKVAAYEELWNSSAPLP